MGGIGPPYITRGPIPSYWKPNTVLISEGGLYRLLCESTKPEAINFERWVFNEVLPTLRETGAYTMISSNHNQVDSLIKSFETQIQFLTEQVKVKDQQIAAKEQLNIKLQEKVIGLYNKAAVMTHNDESKKKNLFGADVHP